MLCEYRIAIHREGEKRRLRQCFSKWTVAFIWHWENGRLVPRQKQREKEKKKKKRNWKAVLLQETYCTLHKRGKTFNYRMLNSTWEQTQHKTWNCRTKRTEQGKRKGERNYLKTKGCWCCTVGSIIRTYVTQWIFFKCLSCPPLSTR